VPGAWVGAAALSAGVCTEAVAAHVMARGVVRGLLAGTVTLGERGSAVPDAPLPHRSAATPAGALSDTGPDAGAGAEDVAAAETAQGPIAGRGRGSGGIGAAVPDRAAGAPGYGEIARFYYPLALTSFIALTVHPMLTFFMGRAPMPVESLAVFPVVHALSFLFRAAGFSFQEAVIALSGRRCEHIAPLARFGVTMAIVSAGGLAIVAFTPLAGFWFEVVSGLPPELSAFALCPHVWPCCCRPSPCCWRSSRRCSCRRGARAPSPMPRCWRSRPSHCSSRSLAGPAWSARLRPCWRWWAAAWPATRS
jgi:hypothetical protein